AGAGRVDVAVRVVPDARLVVQHVIADAAGPGCPPGGDEMLHPAALERDIGGRVGVVRVVAGDEAAAGADAVAGVGEIRPIVAGLRAVLGNREAGQLAAVGP